MKPAEADLGPVELTSSVNATLILSALVVLLIGIFPGIIYNLAMSSVKIFPS
jgi:hypothetical membrane protein